MYDFDAIVCACDECPYCSDDWCDKVGGKLSLYGICDDAITTIHMNRINTNRQNRGLAYRRRMRRKKINEDVTLSKPVDIIHQPVGWIMNGLAECIQK